MIEHPNLEPDLARFAGAASSLTLARIFRILRHELARRHISGAAALAKIESKLLHRTGSTGLACQQSTSTHGTPAEISN